MFDHRHCWTDGRTGVNVSCVARVTSIRLRRRRPFFLSIFYRGTKHWRFRWRRRLRLRSVAVAVAVARALCKLLAERAGGHEREAERRRVAGDISSSAPFILLSSFLPLLPTLGRTLLNSGGRSSLKPLTKPCANPDAEVFGSGGETAVPHSVCTLSRHLTLLPIERRASCTPSRSTLICPVFALPSPESERAKRGAGGRAGMQAAFLTLSNRNPSFLPLPPTPTRLPPIKSKSAQSSENARAFLLSDRH